MACYARGVKVLALAAVAACSINGAGPAPVTARPAPDPERMPSEVLDHQAPSADTSKHPELSRTEAHYHDPNGPAEGVKQLLGCMKMFSCSTTHTDDNDMSGLLVVAAALVAAKRRRNRS